MKKDSHINEFVSAISNIEGISETVVVAAKNDVDY